MPCSWSSSATAEKGGSPKQEWGRYLKSPRMARSSFQGGNFAMDANSSLLEVLCHSSRPAALMAALAPATYTRLVQGRRLGRDCLGEFIRQDLCRLRLLALSSASQRPDLLNHGEQKGGGQPEQKHPA
jgi:hypothetical protein